LAPKPIKKRVLAVTIGNSSLLFGAAAQLPVSGERADSGKFALEFDANTAYDTGDTLANLFGNNHVKGKNSFIY
jgi:hypothetical protein